MSHNGVSLGLALEQRPSVTTKDKGPPVADGALTVTPDPPELAGLKSVLDEEDEDASNVPLPPCVLLPSASSCSDPFSIFNCRRQTQCPVWQVYMENRKLLRNQQAGAQEQSV